MGNEIMKIIDSLNKNIDGINKSLKTILDKDGGVVIHDTFANISSWVDLGTTLFATIVGALVGGWITIQLFKQQEKMRIKQELRLEFYKGYKPLYKQYIDEIINLEKIARKVNIISESGQGLKLKVSDWGKNKNLEYCENKHVLDNLIKSSKNSVKHLDEVIDYINMNKIILTGYKDKLFESLVVRFSNVNDKIFKLEKVHSEIAPLYNPRYTVEKLIDEYDGVVENIIESYNEIMDIVSISEKIHSELECEFLNQYFKNSR